MKALHQTPKYLEPMLLLEYEIEAHRDSIYQAWTEVEVFRKWFCPAGFSVALAEMDAKAGGYFRVHMKSPDGEIFPTKGEYILLDKPNRIVYKDSWDDNRENNETIVAEIVFESNGAKTIMKLYSSFATAQQKEIVLASGILDGWRMFFDNLNRLVKA